MLAVIQGPPDALPDAIDPLAIGLVANKYTKLGKASQPFVLSQGLYYTTIPLCYTTPNLLLQPDINATSTNTLSAFHISFTFL